MLKIYSLELEDFSDEQLFKFSVTLRHSTPAKCSQITILYC